MRNALTIDVEDYFMVSAFAECVAFESWDSYESRVEASTQRILDLLARYRIKATFFVLGWVGEKCPGLVRDIASSGHEIACHGYNHRLVYDLSHGEFREDVKRAKAVLEHITGTPVTGYRATSYSIMEKTLWALDILIEEGFLYDSSIFPIHHDRYGFPRFDRFPVNISRNGGKKIFELPLSTVRFFGKNIPIAGGGYLRLFPVKLTKWAIRRINEREGQPAIIYVHPWEFDPEQPRIKGHTLSLFRHYINLDTTEKKISSLLDSFSFGTITEVFKLNNKDDVKT